MEKIKKTRTAYIGIELVGINNSKVSAKTLDILKHLHEEGVIENYELFVTDSHPLKETKKVISFFLFEIMKLKDFSDGIVNKVTPAVKFLVDFVNRK